MASVAEEFYEQNHGSTEPESGTERGEEEESERYDGSECSDSSEAHGEIVESVIQEMAKLQDTFNNMGIKFRMIDRIGEGMAVLNNQNRLVLISCLLGTFSTVYKAEDLRYDYYQNDWDTEKWLSLSRQNHSRSSTARKPQKKPHFVAIKKIYVTSSPMRIHNELELLHDLRGCKSVCPLITAFRHQDQVVAVLPYFSHHDFRVFFPALLLAENWLTKCKVFYRQMDCQDIRLYFRSLFEALAAVHRHGIIHRDIKPT